MGLYLLWEFALAVIFPIQIQSSTNTPYPPGNGYEPEGREFESLRAHHNFVAIALAP